MGADYQLFEENGKYGVKDEKGKVVITPAFEALGWSDGSFSIVGQVTGYKTSKRWGLINLKAQRLTEAEYLNLYPSAGDRIIAKKQIDAVTSKWGVLILKGHITVPFKYDGIKIDGLRAIVFTKNNTHYKYGVINLNGEVIIPLHHKNIYTIGTLRYGVQNDENKSALFSETGRQLTGFVIDSISSFDKNRAIIYQGLMQGIINRDGVMEVPPQYREIIIDEKGIINARAMNKWFLMDQQNNIIDTAICDELIPTSSGLIVKKGNYFGTWEVNFNPILPTAYQQIQQVEGNLAVVKKDNKYGLINTDNAVIIPFRFDAILLNEKLVRTKEIILGKPSWSLYDIYGVRKSVHDYESISSFNGKFFKVKNYGLSGIVDQYGKEIIPCLYDSIIDYNDDQIAVKFHGHYGIIDFKENWLLPPQPFPVQLIDENHYMQFEQGIQLFKSFSNELIYFTENNLSIHGKMLKEVLPDGTEKEINFEGVTVSRTTPAVVNDTKIITAEHEGFRGIVRNGKYGFIDNRGRLRIANRYEGIGNFKNGLAAVKILGKWGFINAEDKIAINPSYESVSEFENTVTIVKKGKFGFIDRTGKLVLETRYDSIQPLATDNFLISLNRLLGLADENGVVLIDARFETLNDLGNGFVIISSANKYGLLTESGFSAIPMIYDQLYYLPEQNQFLAKQESPWVKLTK
ncbi:MAG: WG repeat-containing protein [Cyclobacteriaceae bacterium]|nr:WG repeat-containing protein [Cyclobacteriaceae bacterium]